MGQKTNPIGNRVGFIRGWDSAWYGGKNFGDRILEDYQIRKYLHARLVKASVSKIVIERTLKNIIVTISTSRPGLIIGKGGKNISVDEADDYIMGYTIMNDLSARALQKEEMKLSLGPAKGKDFLTTLGPFIITKDDIEDKRISSQNGDRYDLNMRAYLNGKLLSEDNFKNITWTFAQIISHISMGTTLYPGDVIGSGTCATGCLLEINLKNKSNNWLKINDVVRLEIDNLGKLENKINVEKINE